MCMNDTFLKLFRKPPGEGRGQVAEPDGAPGQESWPSVGPSILEEPTRTRCQCSGEGPFGLPLEAQDGTVYTSGGHEIDAV